VKSTSSGLKTPCSKRLDFHSFFLWTGTKTATAWSAVEPGPALPNGDLVIRLAVRDS
jgi:hypothetical protein